ncbi:zinc finger and SCAN domain-containing protein 2-like isoform X1 [Melanotaenia boesemani]|uniref:zinc finger and SCAN domain-containing protein 2-like isoform X1 n=1 Tax=Melanotaenia boesemani TaxID=1250792 RepID=UPI001C056F0A|nr:zinc finger and SCAN domain-containing protein 2-like isoform X1 [Melanotaenia boesemani]
MSSVQHLREFISERLTAAAEEIFTEFEKTIVQYEEEIDRQRRLLDITWNPQIKLIRTEVPHQYVYKVDEALQDDQQLCNQNSNLDQEQPESARIKEEEEELLSSQEEERLWLKDETDQFSIPAAHEEDGHSDPEPNRDHTPSYSPPADQHSPLEESMVEDSGPTTCADTQPEKSCLTETNENVGESFLLESHCNERDEKQHSCKFCGKQFKIKNKLTVHVRTHTGERPYSCQTCGKCFSHQSNLVRHMKIHSGLKQFFCPTCGKCFFYQGNLVRHMRAHTGEKPYSCPTCGKCFNQTHYLKYHMRIHTGKRPYSCQTCGKCFGRQDALVRHMRIHTAEK